MCPDNAALESVETFDNFSAMTDRELAEYNARVLTEIVTKVNSIVDQVTPAMDKLQKHPLLGGLFRG